MAPLRIYALNCPALVKGSPMKKDTTKVRMFMRLLVKLIRNLHIRKLENPGILMIYLNFGIK